MSKRHPSAHILTKRYLEREYVDKKRSTSSIAEQHSMYPNQIRRLLKKYGIAIRNSSQAQKNNIKQNGHPMEGRPRTDEEKAKISAGIQSWWEGLGPDELKEIKELKREVGLSNWKNMSQEAQIDMLKKMRTGARASVGQGSANENGVAALLAAKYNILQRTTYYTGPNSYEIDIALPDQKIAIEWDGATHYTAIFGAENLLKVMQKDEEKNKLLLGQGWTVIRCRDHSTSPSNAFCRRAARLIEEKIQGAAPKTLYILDMQ
jgi:hypothetical protein